MPLICAFRASDRTKPPKTLPLLLDHLARWDCKAAALQIREKIAVKNDNLLLRGNPALIALLTAPAASRFINVLAQICGNGKGEAGRSATRRKTPENPL
jgi:hypothetical protein